MYHKIMSASELLKKVRALPLRERRKFLRQVIAMEQRGSVGSASRARRVKWPDVEARARRNSQGRVLPNLVLLEREDAAF
jgi:hypothetical protein